MEAKAANLFYPTYLFQWKVNQMNQKKFVLLFFPLGLLLAAGLVLRPLPTASAISPTQNCYDIFLPVIMGSGSLAQSDANTAAPAGLVAPPTSPQAGCPDEAAFPDFNGDGYADLAIGVPNESVTQGATYDDAGAVHVIYGTENGLVALAASAAVDDQLWHRGIAGLDEIAIDGGDSFGQALAVGDFNQDGFDDLAIGVPGSIVAGQEAAGAVQVMYGSADGLTVDGSQTWTQDSAGVEDTPGAGDEYGATLTTADFDGDGYDDLAVGVPHETVNGDDNAGAINILYGSGNGLRSTLIGGGRPDEFLTQDSINFFTSAQPEDRFGHTLTAGDFDGDGLDDLAVGVPYEDFAGGLDNAGAVQVFFGAAGGILDESARFPQQISANTPGVDNAQEASDLFGYSLAAADFNGDGRDDLAIGTPYETHGDGGGALLYAGAVNIVFGSANGMNPEAGAPIWTQDSPGIDSEAEAEEFFGWKLAAADFNNDGYADLAIGVPQDHVLGVRIGSVHILYGDETGPTAVANTQIFDPHNPEVDDHFGFAVTAADTNGDGYVDLAVGAYEDDPADIAVGNAGSVFVFHSDGSGVSQTDNQNWYQNHNGVAGAPEPGDRFGKVLP